MLVAFLSFLHQTQCVERQFPQLCVCVLIFLQILVYPYDRRIPKIRIGTRQAESLLGKRYVKLPCL